jgi:hypothetical protein
MKLGNFACFELNSLSPLLYSISSEAGLLRRVVIE